MTKQPQILVLKLASSVSIREAHTHLKESFYYIHCYYCTSTEVVFRLLSISTGVDFSVTFLTWPVCH